MAARYPNIGDHGLIGDLQTAALVSTDGVLDWFCCPRFDSPSVFASLLDADQGGFYRIVPDRDDSVSRQLYLPDTAILVTRFMTPDGGRRGARLHAGHRGRGDRPAPAGAEHPRGPEGGTMLRVILNVIWLIFEGLWMAIAYALAGLLAFILIITIPFGIAAFRIAGYVLWPFGRTIDRRPTAGVASVIGNVIWIILFGWWLALGHLVSGVLLCLTIIGIPLGLASFKIIPITLVPLGVRIVPADSVYANAA